MTMQTEIPEYVMKAAVVAFNEAIDMDGYEGSYDIIARAIMAERERNQWQPIQSYNKDDKFTTVRHILCAHEDKKWTRMGRWYPEVGKWYYSGTNERSQWAQVEGDEPTHWMPLPSPPKQEA